MAGSRVHHSLNRAAITKMLQSEQGPVARDMMRRGLRVATRAKANLAGVGGPRRINHGRLRASVAPALIRIRGGPGVRVGSNVWYASLVHDGTGIYGPRGQVIRPKRAKVLVFTPRGASRPVAVRYVRGMQPNRFLKNALPAARG